MNEVTLTATGQVGTPVTLGMVAANMGTPATLGMLTVKVEMGSVHRTALLTVGLQDLGTRAHLSCTLNLRQSPPLVEGPTTVASTHPENYSWCTRS